MEAWTLTSESILPTGRKTRALLAIIALSAPRPVLRGKLAEMLWSRRPEEQARASLRQEIHRLLDALDPLGSQVLSITRDHLALRPGTVWVDVEELLRANPAKPAALGLYDGELLEGLDGIDSAFDGWLAGERQRLSDRARTLAELLLRDQTDPEMMVASAQQLLRIDRAHEGAWRALMRAHMARGERGMAVQAYERCRLALADQLDAQPSAETQRLLNEIRTSVAPKPALAAEPPQSVGSAAPAGHAGSGAASGSARPVPFRPVLRPVARATLHPLDEADEGVAAAAARAEATRQDVAERSEASHGLGLSIGARAPAPRGGPRIGVLPLQLVGTSEAEAYLSVGLADEITAALAKFRWTFLAPTSSLVRFAAPTRDEDAIRQTLSLDYLVDGTAQRSGPKLRVSLRLLDLYGGNQVIWTRRFDLDGDDLLTLQDQVAEYASAEIDRQIVLVEAQRSANQLDGEPSAYALALAATSLVDRLERLPFMQAGDMLKQSIFLQDSWAYSHLSLAYWHTLLATQGWTSDFEAAAAEARRLADRAVALDPQDSNALTVAGLVRAVMHRRPREAIQLHERALAVNPNLSTAWEFSAYTFACLGDPDEAERRLLRCGDLSPAHPRSVYFQMSRMLVPLLRRDYVAAAEVGREVTEMNPLHVVATRLYLSALGHARVEHAHMQADVDQMRDRLLAQEPDFSVSRYMVRSPLDRLADRENIGEGLRLAGVPG